jgi:hypothetical protein
MRETLAAQNAVHHEHAAGNSATKRSDLRNLRHGWSKNGLLHMEQRGLRRSAMLPQQASWGGGGAKARAEPGCSTGSGGELGGAGIDQASPCSKSCFLPGLEKFRCLPEKLLPVSGMMRKPKTSRWKKEEEDDAAAHADGGKRFSSLQKLSSQKGV